LKADLPYLAGMNKTPRNVVFDIGNVLIKWDPRLLYRKMFATEAEIDHFLTTICPPEWNLEQDRGRAWADAEALLIAKHPAFAEPIRAWRARWHETIPGAIEGTVQILERLKSDNVPLYAITNFAGDTFEEAKLRFPFLATSFIDIVVSAHEKLLKPDPAIYRVLLARNSLEAKDCIFIDDSKANIAAANALGFTGLLFETPEKLSADLAALKFSV
jgi:2-haloacid dehalogenase